MGVVDVDVCVLSHLKEALAWAVDTVSGLTKELKGTKKIGPF